MLTGKTARAAAIIVAALLAVEGSVADSGATATAENVIRADVPTSTAAWAEPPSTVDEGMWDGYARGLVDSTFALAARTPMWSRATRDAAAGPIAIETDGTGKIILTYSLAPPGGTCSSTGSLRKVCVLSFTPGLSNVTVVIVAANSQLTSTTGATLEYIGLSLVLAQPVYVSDNGSAKVLSDLVTNEYSTFRYADDGTAEFMDASAYAQTVPAAATAPTPIPSPLPMQGSIGTPTVTTKTTPSISSAIMLFALVAAAEGVKSYNAVVMKRRTAQWGDGLKTANTLLANAKSAFAGATNNPGETSAEIQAAKDAVTAALGAVSEAQWYVDWAPTIAEATGYVPTLLKTGISVFWAYMWVSS